MDKLEYVLTLAEERNLTRAANRLFISQPTLTNYINRLERELGIRLFDRGVQPITVTEAGLIYIEDMKKIQNRELILRSKLDTLKRKDQNFTIGVPAVRGAYDLPDVICQFMKRYPDLNVTIDNRLEEELEKDVAAGRIDVAIGMLTTAYPAVHYEQLQEDAICLLVPRSYACVSRLAGDEGTLEHPFLLEPGCLNQLTMLLSRTGGGHYRMAMIAMEKYGIVPKNTIRCGSMNLLYQLAGEGVGFLFATPRLFIKAYPNYTDRIAYCTLQHEQQVQKTYMAYLDDNPKGQILCAFTDILKEYTKRQNISIGGL